MPKELELPENCQIGYCKTVRFIKLPEPIQQQLILDPDRSSSLFFHTDVDTNAIFKAKEIELWKKVKTNP